MSFSLESPGSISMGHGSSRENNEEPVDALSVDDEESYGEEDEARGQSGGQQQASSTVRPTSRSTLGASSHTAALRNILSVLVSR